MHLQEIAFRVLRKALSTKYIAGAGDDKIRHITHAITNVPNHGTDTEHQNYGSSRIYLKHKDLHPVKIDGKNTHMEVGLKVSRLGPYDHDGVRSLGSIQNQAEHHPYNDQYRVLVRTGGTSKKPEFKYNPHGVLPPLIKHDQKHHEWSMVGHVRPIIWGDDMDFKKLTIAKGFPKGLYAHEIRFHLETVKKNPEYQGEMDNHPLVQRLNKYYTEAGDKALPGDFGPGNIGIWHHPITKKKHLVILDHGYDVHTKNRFQGGMS